MGKKRLTREEFIEKVFQKNKHYANREFDIVGEYVNYHTPIECYCSKHDLHWSPTPASLCDGWGCPSCGTESTANHRRITHEEFVNRLLQNNKYYANGDFILNGIYTGSNKPIDCHCNVHNIDWSPVPTNLYKGCGCPNCGRESAVKKMSVANKTVLDENKNLFDNKKKILKDKEKSSDKNKVSKDKDKPSNPKSRLLTHEKFLKNLSKKNKHYANGDFDVIGRYMGAYEPIECHCNIHNVDWSPLPINLGKGSGCHYCWGKRTVVGYNDMWTIRPDIASMLQDPEDGYRYTAYSNKKTWFICPDCKTPSLKTVVNVSFHNFGCQHCSDSVSYPNKFGRALLDQFPIDEYDYEYQPDWAKPYYYDNHFFYNGIEYILEMDGDFHFKEQQVSRNTLEQVQARDRLKDELAFEHDIHMIRIECIKSDMEYIRANILKSELNRIFDLSNIDWNLCDQKAQKNILKEACKLYASNSYTLKEIGKILQVHPATVSKYLVKGAKFGWCDYIPLKSKAVVVVDDNGQIIHSFNSMSECNREMKRLYGIAFSNEYLRKALETHEPYHGFNFRFASEFNNNN